MEKQDRPVRRVLKIHGTCRRDDAVLVYNDAGDQIGWRCAGCGAPFGLDAWLVSLRFRVVAPVAPGG